MSTFAKSFSRGLGYGLAIGLIRLLLRKPLWTLLLLGAVYFSLAHSDKAGILKPNARPLKAIKMLIGQ